MGLKNKLRGVMGIGAGVSISVILVLCSEWRSSGGEIMEEPVETLVSYEPKVKLDISTRVFEKGESFGNVLGSMGLNHDDMTSCYEAMKSAGLKAVFPGDSLVLKRDASGGFLSCKLLNRMSKWFRVERMDTSFKCNILPLKVSKHVSLIRGSLEECLSVDMFNLGGGYPLVQKIARIFAWDINFFMDPRKGDEFTVLFEKRYKGGKSLGYGRVLAAKYVNAGEAFYAFGIPDSSGEMSYYNFNGESVEKEFLKAPLSYTRLSSGFSYNRLHPVLGYRRPHLGVDYAAPSGTPVYSVADGKVVFSGKRGGYGNHVRIRHGAAFVTYYGHMSRINSGIKPGARVSQGEMVGTVGATGLATGPHLDYRVKKGGEFINPDNMKAPSKESISENDVNGFQMKRSEYLMMLENRFEGEGCFLVDVSNGTLEIEQG